MLTVFAVLGVLFVLWQLVELTWRVRRLQRARVVEQTHARWLGCARCQQEYAQRGYPSLGYQPSCRCPDGERVRRA